MDGGLGIYKSSYSSLTCRIFEFNLKLIEFYYFINQVEFEYNYLLIF